MWVEDKQLDQAYRNILMYTKCGDLLGLDLIVWVEAALQYS